MCSRHRGHWRLVCSPDAERILTEPACLSSQSSWQESQEPLPRNSRAGSGSRTPPALQTVQGGKRGLCCAKFDPFGPVISTKSDALSDRGRCGQRRNLAREPLRLSSGRRSASSLRARSGQAPALRGTVPSFPLSLHGPTGATTLNPSARMACSTASVRPRDFHATLSFRGSAASRGISSASEVRCANESLSESSSGSSLESSPESSVESSFESLFESSLQSTVQSSDQSSLQSSLQSSAQSSRKSSAKSSRQSSSESSTQSSSQSSVHGFFERSFEG